MIGRICVALIGSVAALASVSMPARAADREHGPKIEVHDNGKDYKYEYKDRRCKYEYHLNYRTGEEKTEKKGDCRGVSPHRAIYYSEGPARGYEGDRGARGGDYEGGRDSDYGDLPPTGDRVACNRELIGRVIGGIAGGVLGSKVGDGSGRRVATVAGAIIGVVIGGNIGRKMDRADHGCAYQAFEFGAPGDTIYWRNPESGMEYGLTPAHRSRGADGRECRKYTASVAGAASNQSSSSGVACRRSDGSWEIT